jgi:hypothetical protein
VELTVSNPISFLTCDTFYNSHTDGSCVASINAFKLGTCEYKIMSIPHVFSGSLLLAHFTLPGTG